MSNNYLQFATALVLRTPEEKTWCEWTLGAFAALFDSERPWEVAEHAAALGPLADRATNEGWESVDFEWDIAPLPSGEPGVARVLFYAEESGNAEQVAAVIQVYLQKFDPKRVHWFAWAYTCSKMRVYEFGGGAVVITATHTRYLDVQTWAQEQVAPMAKQVQVL